jgi:hypothetical protein
MVEEVDGPIGPAQSRREIFQMTTVASEIERDEPMTGKFAGGDLKDPGRFLGAPRFVEAKGMINPTGGSFRRPEKLLPGQPDCCHPISRLDEKTAAQFNDFRELVKPGIDFFEFDFRLERVLEHEPALSGFPMPAVRVGKSIHQFLSARSLHLRSGTGLATKKIPA